MPGQSCSIIQSSISRLFERKKRQRRDWMRLEAMWKTAKVRPDFLHLSLELAQPFMSQMLPLKGLTGLQKQVTAISFFYRSFKTLFHRVLECIHFWRQLILINFWLDFPGRRFLCSLFVVVVFASWFSTWEPRSVLNVRSCGTGLSPASSRGPGICSRCRVVAPACLISTVVSAGW